MVLHLVKATKVTAGLAWHKVIAAYLRIDGLDEITVDVTYTV